MRQPIGRLALLSQQIRQRRQTDPGGFAVGVLLGTGVVVAIGLLILAPKPWSAGVVAKLRSGDDVKVIDYAITWGWVATAVNTCLLGGLLLSLRHWWDRAGAPETASLAAPSRRPSAAWGVLVVAACLVSGALAFPRLSMSLWDDEVYNVRKAIDGSWKPEADGELVFREVGWSETLWYYRMPNNHVPHTVLARLSLNLWQQTGEHGGRRLGEAALRAPAFVAGMGAVAALALLLWRAGFPAAGVLAAWLLALHPWHLRYSGEARGYTMVLLLVSLHLLLLLLALRRGTWPRWLAFSGAQALMIWTYPAIVHHVAIANLALLAGLLQLHRGTPALRSQLTRWMIATLLGAMAFLQVMAPNLPQLVNYVQSDKTDDVIGLRWLRDVGGYLLVGMPWKQPVQLGPHYPQMFDRSIGATPPAFLAGAAVALAAVALGFARLFIRGGVTRLVGLVLLLPGPVTYVYASSQGIHLHEWYLIFMLPGWVALVALALSWPLDAAVRTSTRGMATALVLAVLCAFVVATATPRHVLRTRSLQPRRDSVEVTRPNPDPLAPGQERILTASFREAASLYDPRVQLIHTRPELLALMEQAGREERPLFVNIGWISRARRRHPELMQVVTDTDLFEEVALLHAFEPKLSRAVYRYRGPGAPPSGDPDPGDGLP
jgi:hypothetical protein